MATQEEEDEGAFRWDVEASSDEEEEEADNEALPEEAQEKEDEEEVEVTRATSAIAEKPWVCDGKRFGAPKATLCMTLLKTLSMSSRNTKVTVRTLHCIARDSLAACSLQDPHGA